MVCVYILSSIRFQTVDVYKRQLLTVPGITEVVKHAILMAWAYGEGLVDLRALVAGKKVPLVKNKENWNLQLSELLRLGEHGVQDSGQDSGEGMTYQEMCIRDSYYIQHTSTHRIQTS